LIWQLNDCWPVQSWALLDSLGEPKPALVALSRLYASGLISLVQTDGAVELWGILDNTPSGAELTGTASLRAVSLLDGSLLGSWSSGVHVASSERKRLLAADISALPATETLLFAELGELSAWCLLAKPKQLSLPSPSPIQASLSGDGTLALRISGPVVDLWLSDADGARAFGRNLLTLPQSGVARVPYSGSGRGLGARSLAGQHAITFTRAPLY
jgi:beta-mannosidase